MKGTRVGSAEVVRMSAVTIGDGPIFHGRVSAVWGLELSPTIEMNAQTVRGLGVGKTFLPMKRSHRARAGEGSLISAADGCRLSACPTLHLDSSIRFSLDK